MKILITGEAGYIGTHTLKENSQMEENSQFSILNSQLLTDGDIRDKQKLQETFRNYTIDSVIHFAGLKAEWRYNDKVYNRKGRMDN